MGEKVKEAVAKSVEKGKVRGEGFGQIRHEDGGCECPQGGEESQEDAVGTLVPLL